MRRSRRDLEIGVNQPDALRRRFHQPALRSRCGAARPGLAPIAARAPGDLDGTRRRLQLRKVGDHHADAGVLAAVERVAASLTARPCRRRQQQNGVARCRCARQKKRGCLGALLSAEHVQASGQRLLASSASDRRSAGCRTRCAVRRTASAASFMVSTSTRRPARRPPAKDLCACSPSTTIASTGFVDGAKRVFGFAQAAAQFFVLVLEPVDGLMCAPSCNLPSAGPDRRLLAGFPAGTRSSPNSSFSSLCMVPMKRRSGSGRRLISVGTATICSPSSAPASGRYPRSRARSAPRGASRTAR